ncbi:MAG: ferritin-like domain-containing protein [Gammaproteobacteria bacterium]|nr:ferritin-like domain-containing protein [Gammaproteobacteria bacterium]
MPELFQLIEAVILEPDVNTKCESVTQLQLAWSRGKLNRDVDCEILPFDDPGRPPEPVLVDPRQLKRRSISSVEGRNCLLHAFAHIEFNAINIALDAAYRFRDMPDQFVSDWLLIASEEVRHFGLLESELRRRGSRYGAYQAHRGLWDMVCKTRHNLLHRMGLVPRVMEARGLDVTPAIIEKFKQVQDQPVVNILEEIYRDEIGHVRIGNYWYRWLCEQQGVDADATFRDLIEEYMDGRLRGPFNRPARLQAGFEANELDSLERDLAQKMHKFAQFR